MGRDMDNRALFDRRLTRRSALVLPAAAITAMTVARRSGAAAQIEQTNNDELGVETGRYFATTGHNLREPYLDRWTKAGGEKVLGVPLSEERYDPELGLVQTFEGMTLIYDPTLESPWDIQGQHLPDEIVKQVAPSSARRKVTGSSSSSSSSRFFAERGHSISGRIAAFWEDNGDLPIFGMPLSEPFKDANGVTVQVFERAIVQDRGSDGVQLRPYGRILAEAQGLLTADPAFQPAPPSGGLTKLVKAEDGLRLRSGPSVESDIIMVLPDNAEFTTPRDSRGDWIPGYADGYAGWVSSDFLKEPPKLPTLSVSDWNPAIWQGAALGQTNVRKQPTTKSDIVDVLEYGDTLTVTAWVKGEEVFEGADGWAQIGTDRYIYARNIGRNAPIMAPPLPDDAPSRGKWIDVHLTQQLMTAYDGRDPVRVTVTTTGMPGWETPPGFYAINWRVANETMTSGAIGAEHFYKLEDVLFTQYFTDRGHAIHFAWWRTPETIGRPGSHGCLNLLLDDSRFFWEWAEIGTPVYVRQR
jgi:uncharacterized protein YgiM (DUF1202 family)